MDRRRRESQALRSARNRWEVDRLHVDSVILKEHIAKFLGMHRVANDHRYDMRTVINQRQTQSLQARFQDARAILMDVPTLLIRFQVADRGRRARGNPAG